VKLNATPDGWLTFGTQRVRCALGKGGVVRRKREGDGATPAGRWPLLAVLYRPDRVARPRTALPAAPISRFDGWCDWPRDPNYNRPVRLPYPARAERMWRTDRLYDIVVVLAYNMSPVRPHRGSAVFFHLAKEGYAPTEGCVAVAESDMRTILERAGPGSLLTVARP
jgi:L,D-peptidoglycan transpeptidase YkuD (ErfK/YbiS/YcfS/YnhG family)